MNLRRMTERNDRRDRLAVPLHGWAKGLRGVHPSAPNVEHITQSRPSYSATSFHCRVLAARSADMYSVWAHVKSLFAKYHPAAVELSFIRARNFNTRDHITISSIFSFFVNSRRPEDTFTFAQKIGRDKQSRADRKKNDYWNEKKTSIILMGKDGTENVCIFFHSS